MTTIYLKQYNKIVRNPDSKLFEELGYDDILWIDLFSPSLKEQKEVESFMEINLQSRQEVEEIETSSKYFETENAVFANTNFFLNQTEGVSAEPVSFAVSEGVLITMRSNEYRTFTEAEKRLQMNSRAYPTGYHLLISILDIRIDADADTVEAMSKQIAALSKDITESEKVEQTEVKRISMLQENTMLIREIIFDRQRILSGILKSERFPNDIYPRLQLMIKDVNSIISHADFSFERLDFLRETTLSLINLELNNTTKIFTTASVFFMPATLIASIYGMNFAIMPELKWKYGYLLAIAFMLLISFLTYRFFKHKKWL
jgi:magnesium transporter